MRNSGKISFKVVLIIKYNGKIRSILQIKPCRRITLDFLPIKTLVVFCLPILLMIGSKGMNTSIAMKKIAFVSASPSVASGLIRGIMCSKRSQIKP